jgi:diketogulonate reductase-like aldo/keto reductase
LKRVQPLLEFQQKHGIETESYGGLSPLTQCPDGPLTPVLKNITEAVAKRRGKPVTETQILLKWLQKKQIIIVT